MELSHIADKFSHGTGGAIALAMIAFSVVFLVLIALTLIIMGTRYLADLSERKPMKPAGPEQKAAPAPVAPSAPAAWEGGDKNVIAAVIAAAIAASSGGRATSIRPLAVTGRGKPSAWKTAGRMDLLEGFE